MVTTKADGDNSHEADGKLKLIVATEADGDNKSWWYQLARG